MFVRCVLDLKLSVPHIWIYTPSDANLSHLYLVYSNVYVDMEKITCYTRPIHGKGTLALRWDKFNSHDPFTYYDWTLPPLHLCNSKLVPWFFTPRRAQPLSASPGHVCETVAEIVLARAPFPWIDRALHGASSFLTNWSRRQI